MKHSAGNHFPKPIRKCLFSQDDRCTWTIPIRGIRGTDKGKIEEFSFIMKDSNVADEKDSEESLLDFSRFQDKTEWLKINKVLLNMVKIYKNHL